MNKQDNPQYKSHYKRFKQFRQHLGLNQTEFGKVLGFDQTTISKIEVGGNDVTIRTIYDLKDLDCNPNWLLFNEPPMLFSNLNRAPQVEVIESKSHLEYRLTVKK